MNKGLTTAQAAAAAAAGHINKVENKSALTVRKILRRNILTYFNFIFFFLAALILLAQSYNNLMFLPVIIINSAIGIIQQLKSKKVLDELSLLDVTEYVVIRDGKEKTISSEELVLGDLVKLKSGQQIPADGYVEEGQVSVNESLLTGESDEIDKTSGAELKSGSFVVSGHCTMTLTKVGAESYVAQLSSQAKSEDDKKTEMIRDIETIVRVAGILIIPVGLLLFIQSILMGNNYETAIVSSVAAVIGMIPEGLFLLTTIVLAISSARLAHEKVMLHDMRSIESLARVNVLCVDKTGTVTSEDMTVTEIFAPSGTAPEASESKTSDKETDNGDSVESDAPDFAKSKDLLNRYIHTVQDVNSTMAALRDYLQGTAKLDATEVKEFSSRTKYSQITTADTMYRFGAPEFILSEDTIAANREVIEAHTGLGQRVVVFAEVKEEKAIPLAFVSLENELREHAKEIFHDFEARDVKVKVISGDNPLTVSMVARRAGITGAENYVDAGTLTDREAISHAVETYTVFGRVKPDQKRMIVECLQEKGQKVAMTGDGVNDILAMKEADCSIAMGSGSDAARQAAQVVLLDSNFAHLNDIVAEGRKNINNVTRSATLFLYKNLFSLLLAVFSIFNMLSYPLSPSQLTLVSFFNIGAPAFLLAMENDYSRKDHRFLTHVLIKAMPAAITSFLVIASLMLFQNTFDLPASDMGTASTWLLSTVGFILLIRMCIPPNKYRVFVLVLCVAGCYLAGIFLPSLFNINALTPRAGALVIIYTLTEIGLLDLTERTIDLIQKKRREKAAARAAAGLPPKISLGEKMMARRKK